MASYFLGMLTVMLGFQTYHQWADHQWEQHAHEEEEDGDCDLCDWNLSTFLKPVALGEMVVLQNLHGEYLAFFSEGFQNQFYASHNGRGPPKG